MPFLRGKRRQAYYVFGLCKASERIASRELFFYSEVFPDVSPNVEEPGNTNQHDKRGDHQ